ncbi:MAG: winged helix-turn-helix domain-containing protein [Rhodospirillales bacterium]|nr:winged helix-turn-helix domain-containing protein [Rhodospirillales bacterium]
MDRQTLRDWVIRYNEAGVDGLRYRSRSGRRPRLNASQLAEPARLVEQGPDIAVHRVVRWRCVDLQAEIKARFGVGISERHVGRILGQLRFRRLSVRPRHPQTDEAAQQAFKKLRHPGERGTARGRRRQADRDLVPGRGADRSEGHPDTLVGPHRLAPSRAAQQPLRMGLSVRSGLPSACRRRRSRDALRQHRGHEPPFAGDRPRGGSRRPWHPRARRRRMAHQPHPYAARQSHAAPPAALLPRTQPGRERLGISPKEQPRPARTRDLRRHRRGLLQRLDRPHRSTRQSGFHHTTALGCRVMNSGGWYKVPRLSSTHLCTL